MNPIEAFGFVVVLFYTVTCLVIGVVIGGCIQERQSNRNWQAEMVKRGHGRYIVTDSLSGATEYRWNEVKP